MNDELSLSLRKFKDFYMNPDFVKGDNLLKEKYFKNIEQSASFTDNTFIKYGFHAGDFTSHGSDHSARMLIYAISLCEILHKEKLYEISEKECYALAMSIILHDIGMTAQLPEQVYIKCNDIYEQWNERRKRHANAIVEMLKDAGQKELANIRHMDSNFYDYFLPEICRSHATVNFVQSVRTLKDLRGLDVGKNYALVSGILLLCDELDITNSRAPKNYNFYNQFSPIAKLHWCKHFVIENCFFEGNVIKIIAVSDKKLHGAKELADWTKKKIDSQLDMLISELDGLFSKLLTKLEFMPIINVSDIPNIEQEIIDLAKSELFSLSDESVKEIINPKSLKEIIENYDEHRNSSSFYRKVIEPNKNIFQGKGSLATPHSIEHTYVWINENKILLDLLENELITIISQRINLPNNPKGNEPFRESEIGLVKQSRFIRTITGSTGVGKTHFLSMFLLTFKNKYTEYHNRNLFIRAECTDCKSLQEVKIEIARNLHEEMQRIDVFNSFKIYINEKSSQSIIVPDEIEIHALDEAQLDNFIKAVGMAIRSSRAFKIFGENAPYTINLFLDNSDKLSPNMLSKLHKWTYEECGNTFSYALIFYRPETFDYLSKSSKIKNDHISHREDDIITPPERIEVLSKRTNYIFKYSEQLKVKAVRLDDVTFLGSDNIEITAVKEALFNICNNLVKSNSFLLSNIALNNHRRTLQLFLRILGSWILDSQTIFNYVLTKENISQDWYTLLESLMLGKRIWYNSEVSPVSNLFKTPEIENFSDYFLCIHIIQYITTRSNTTLFQLQRDMQSLGYYTARINQIIRHLCMVVPNSSTSDEDLIFGRVFPLIEISNVDGKHIDVNQILSATYTLKATKWGQYHLQFIVMTYSYWKHIIYDMIIPEKWYKILDTEKELSCSNNILLILNILKEEEDKWFHNFYINSVSEIKPIMSDVIHMVSKKITRPHNRR